MKKILFYIFPLLCLFSCEQPIDVDNPDQGISTLFGSYYLREVIWDGNYYLDLDEDDLLTTNLLYEIRNMIGYYEPDYTASVGKETNVYSGRNYSVFNLTIPYPFFTQTKDGWKCSCIYNLNQTITVADSDFLLGESFGERHINYRDTSDIFLANIDRISIFVDSFETESFELRIHCNDLPYNGPKNKPESENEGDLIYKFNRVQ